MSDIISDLKKYEEFCITSKNYEVAELVQHAHLIIKKLTAELAEREAELQKANERIDRKNNLLDIREHQNAELRERIQQLESAQEGMVMVSAKDMATIKDCAYVIKDCVEDHMTDAAQRNILYIVRIVDKALSAQKEGAR